MEGIDIFRDLKYFSLDLELDPFLVATWQVILFLSYFLECVFLPLQ